MSSLFDREKDRLKKRDRASAESGGIVAPPPESTFPWPDLDHPEPDAWYVKMMMKRLTWDKCEDRDTVIAMFQQFWPKVADRVGEFYDEAVRRIKEEA